MAKQPAEKKFCCQLLTIMSMPKKLYEKLGFTRSEIMIVAIISDSYRTGNCDDETVETNWYFIEKTLQVPKTFGPCSGDNRNPER